jgi:DNA mismatch repair protein MutS2
MTDQKSLGDLDFHRLIELILDYSVTPLGKREIRRLKQIVNYGELLESLETVGEMQATIEAGADDFSLDFYPLDEELKLLKLNDSILEGTELLRIGQTLRCTRLLRESVSRKKESSPRLWKIVRELRPDRGIEKRIESSIDENGEVKDSASTRLRSLRKKSIVSRTRVLKLLEKTREKIGPEVDTTDGEVTIRNGRYVIPLRVGYRVKVPGIIHDRSRSGATQFIEPQEAIDLNNNLREVELEIYQEINTILSNLSSELRPIAEKIEEDQTTLGRVDSIRARARFSLEYGCSIPEVTQDVSLKLVNARHPLLGKKEEGKVVPLNLELTGEEHSLLVSGPNAGGKTVLLKTVGLLTLMTHCGIPPSLGDGSIIPFLRSIYTDIGDDQSIENDLSTFSSKIKVLKKILAGADNRSMILLDEVGSGTDPSEGQGIALAVIEEFTERGSINIFTTHYTEVKGIAGEKKGVVNGSLGFDPVKIGPTYSFIKGIPGRSYGLEIADRLGLEEQIIDRARSWVPTSHKALDEIIDEWENKRKDILRREEEITRQETELSLVKEEWMKRQCDQEEELEEKRRKSEKEIQEIILDTRKRMEDIISNLKIPSHNSGAEIKRARQKVEKELRTIRKKREKEVTKKNKNESTDPLHAGDIVLIESLGDEGVLLDLGKNECVVRIGNLRVNLPRETLKKLRSAGEARNERKPVSVSGYSGYQDFNEGIVHEIDIRGLLADEVMFRVQKAIDMALLRGVDNVRFIHGKGKGVLRDKVAEILKSEIRVKYFRQGRLGEGGSGVTIARIE